MKNIGKQRAYPWDITRQATVGVSITKRWGNAATFPQVPGTGPKKRIMAYLNWDKAEIDRIEAHITRETQNGRLNTRRRDMSEVWKSAEQDGNEQQARYEA